MQYIQREDVRADRLALVSASMRRSNAFTDSVLVAEANHLRRQLPPQHETRRDPRGSQRRPFSPFTLSFEVS